MSDKVKLKKVTADNWEAVVEPELYRPGRTDG